jgi:hypothetical protein
MGEICYVLETTDAHESSILAVALGLASIFLPRNRLALLEPYSIALAYSPHSFSVVPPFSTTLDATRLYSRGGTTARRPSTRLVLDSPTHVHHCWRPLPCAERIELCLNHPFLPPRPL